MTPIISKVINEIRTAASLFSDRRDLIRPIVVPLIGVLMVTSWIGWTARSGMVPDLVNSAAIMVRGIAILVAMVSIYRAVVPGAVHYSRVNSGVFLFLGVQLTVFLSTGVAIFTARQMLPDVAAIVVLVAVSMTATVCLVRLQPFLVGMAAGTREPGPRASWRAMRGHTLPLIIAYVILIAPLFSAHAVLNSLVKASPGMQPYELAIAVVDGGISTAILLVATMLFACAHLRVTAKWPEPIHQFVRLTPVPAAITDMNETYIRECRNAAEYLAQPQRGTFGRMRFS
ncbi:MAG: hypothetical protein AAF205_03325 [Pseudomonadota bacterium]